MKRTNFTSICGEWRYFDGFCAGYHQFVWFYVEILLVCLLPWFHRVAMTENSIMEAEFKGMSCLMLVKTFKQGNTSLDPSENYFVSSSHQSHSANPFTPKNESDNYSADLFMHH